MKKYNYAGPVSSVTVKPAKLGKDGQIETEGKSIDLFPGKPVSLPEDNKMVMNLVASGLLTEAEPKPSADDKSDTKAQ